MPRMLLIAAALTSIALTTGCGSNDCETVCAKNAECQAEGPGEDACVAACEDLSAKKDSYADAVGEQADCYEDATCEDIEFGNCVAQP